MTKPHQVTHFLQRGIRRAFSFVTGKCIAQRQPENKEIENFGAINPFPNAEPEYRNPRDVKQPPASRAWGKIGASNPFPNIN